MTPFVAPPLHPFDDQTPKTRIIIVYLPDVGGVRPVLALWADKSSNHGEGWRYINSFSGGWLRFAPGTRETIIGWSELAIETTKGPPV